MTDRDALLAAILADPADDLVRLAYADWLDDQDDRVPCPGCKDSGKPGYVHRHGKHGPGYYECPDCSDDDGYPTCSVPAGNAARAEFIRLQCRDLPRLEALLAKPYEDQDLCSDLSANWCPVCGDCCCPSPEDRKDHADCPLHAPDSRHHSDESVAGSITRLRARERDLLRVHARPWSGEVAGLLGVTEIRTNVRDGKTWFGFWGREWAFERGFVGSVRLPTLAEFIGDRDCPRCGGMVQPRNYVPRSRCAACSGLGRVRACPECGGTGSPADPETGRRVDLCAVCRSSHRGGILPALAPALARVPGIAAVEIGDRVPAAVYGTGGQLLTWTEGGTAPSDLPRLLFAVCPELGGPYATAALATSALALAGGGLLRSL